MKGEKVCTFHPQHPCPPLLLLEPMIISEYIKTLSMDNGQSSFICSSILAKPVARSQIFSLFFHFTMSLITEPNPAVTYDPEWDPAAGQMLCFLKGQQGLPVSLSLCLFLALNLFEIILHSVKESHQRMVPQ